MGIRISFVLLLFSRMRHGSFGVLLLVRKELWAGVMSFVCLCFGGRYFDLVDEEETAAS
jgi:hypothetical protein